MKTYNLILFSFVLALMLIVAACESQITESGELSTPSPADQLGAVDVGAAEVSLTDIMDTLNDKIASEELNFRVFKAEYITAEGSGEVGNTVFAKDVGNKQLSFDFVPNDSRRSDWSGPVGGATDNITYAIDQTGDAVPPMGGLTGAETTAAIQRAMGTWDDQTCSDLSLTQNPDGGADIGFVAFLNGLGGSLAILGDIQHAGWGDINFAEGVLGVTFTLIFIDSNGNPTDVDENGKTDVAFREIYYDPSYNWADDGVSHIDVETVALHEAGHGLSQAHFGQIFVTKSGKFKVAPLAVMNAGYTQVQRDLKGTDNGGHCSNWGQWANN